LSELRETPFWNLFAGKIGEFPVQLMWGLGFAFLGWLLFARHKFGGHVCYVGDNLTSAKEMGIRRSSSSIPSGATFSWASS
jgi:simple sugar transport system permease protein